VQINSYEVIIKRTAMSEASVRSRPGKKQACLSMEAERLRLALICLAFDNHESRAAWNGIFNFIAAAFFARSLRRSCFIVVLRFM
jgi:hypothetical protein